jgi:hypothetical protein
LPSKDAEKIFTDEAIAAIANVSGGDPVVVNRFWRRMLECASASAGNPLGKANLDSGTVVSPDGSPRESGVATAAEELRQDFPVPEADAKLATRMSRNRAAGWMLCTGIALCLACVGLITTVEFIHRAAPATDLPAKLGENASSNWAAPDPAMPVAAKKSGGCW